MRAALRRLGSACLALLGLAVLVPQARAATTVEARLNAASIEVGTTVTLSVTVSDPKGNVSDPQFNVPAGLELLGSARSQQFSWVNGRSSNQVVIQFEIGGVRPGRYSIGPIRVSDRGTEYRSDALALVVNAAGSGGTLGGTGNSGGRARNRRRGPADHSDVAALIVSLEPKQPVVGQVCKLRMQLVQRVNMSEDSESSAPATPGFWSETWGDPTSYSAKEGRTEVAVTERSLRVYPLAPGPAIVAPAYAVVSPASGGLLDPFSGISSQRVEIASETLHVNVRPLPDGAPQGFDGGVGHFEVRWTTDREHTTQDQAITARLEVRGTGNLPLLRAPAYAPNDLEVFASTVEDSLPPAGEVGPGRRTFLWTLLPKRAGRVRVPAPTLAWYDPETSRYETSTPPQITLQVLTATGPAGGEIEDGFPSVLRRHAAHPGNRAAWPLLALAGGLLVALAAELRRRSLAPDPTAPERARQREWLRGIGLAHGPDFWRAADEAASWLQQRGDQVLWLREAIQAARYGGRTDQIEEVRPKLIERLASAMPAPPARWPLQVGAGVALASGIVVFVLALPGPGHSALAERAAAADATARAGKAAAAEAEWARLWDERPGDPALAARLAWGALERDDPGAATVWVLRGERQESRDPALGAMAQRVRDAGGLVGAPGRALPLRSTEWAILAFLLAGAAGFLLMRRNVALALAALALVTAVWWPAESWWRGQQRLAVVRAPVALPPGDLQLDAGQVVRVLKRDGDEVDVRVTRDLAGALPASTLWFLGKR
ncbi:MAG: BatD family protein [Candidatus Eisenbacteria bacterium]|nr:BatD family protein [Candidatus Eisenbacteria bacterium]